MFQYYHPKKEIYWSRCTKCGANYQRGHRRYSERQSCRRHDWDALPFPKCKICYLLQSQWNSQHCYHISSDSWCCIL